MTDRKEVMTWLKICGMGDCSECCPYRNGEVRASACYEHLMTDALSVLKEQEPRVLTLEEVLSFDSAIYMDEAQNTVCLKMLYCYEAGRGTYDHGYTFVDSDGDRIYYPAKGFNKTWRCWTARPTDEQRKAVKWN